MVGTRVGLLTPRCATPGFADSVSRDALQGWSPHEVQPYGFAVNRYLVVSDLHLADVEDFGDGWMAHKHSRRLFDDALDDVLKAFEAAANPDDALTLILNGDIFDFDIVTATPETARFPISRGERRRGLEPTSEKAVWKLERILSFHPCFIAMLAGFIERGHRVVYVTGNHDPEVGFPAVQKTLSTAIEAACSAEGFAAERLQFEPWFFYVPGEIYAEHGHQYDYYTSFQYQLSPWIDTPDGRAVALPMGNISNRYLTNRMGFFNPHASDYILNIYRYIQHWLKHYAFTRRGLVIPWLVGSLQVLARIIATKRKQRRDAPDHLQLVREQARCHNIPEQVAVELDALKRQPITGRMYRMVREFWIDRVILAALMTGGTIALALSPVPLWVKLMVPLSSFPLIYLVYEAFAHGETIFGFQKQAYMQARSIARLLPAAVVTFGHSHVPEVIPVRPGTRYVNTGTWAPVTRQADGKLKPGLRNALVVVCAPGDTRVELSTHQIDPGPAADRL